MTKAGDRIYQRPYVPEEKLTRLMNTKDGVGQNPTKDLAVPKGFDVSIGTQPEEERMQVQRLWNHLNNSKLKCKGIMIPNRRIGCRRSD